MEVCFLQLKAGTGVCSLGHKSAPTPQQHSESPSPQGQLSLQRRGLKPPVSWRHAVWGGAPFPAVRRGPPGQSSKDMQVGSRVAAGLLELFQKACGLRVCAHTREGRSLRKILQPLLLSSPPDLLSKLRLV